MSTNLDLCGSQSLDYQPWLEPRAPCTYIADVQLGLHVGPEQLEQELFQHCCLSVGYVLLARLPYRASVEEDVPSPALT